MGFRNRCQVAGAEGIVELSVPLLKGRDQKTLIREVRISNRQAWGAQHWKTISSCYSRSPWFDHYGPELEALYRRKWDLLFDWDMACFEWSVRALGTRISIGLTEEWRRDYAGGEVLDWRGKLVPKGMGREEEGLKEAEAGPGEKWEGTGGRGLRYRQVFEERTGFIPNLSILDLLFCEGPQAIRYIRSF